MWIGMFCYLYLISVLFGMGYILDYIVYYELVMIFKVRNFFILFVFFCRDLEWNFEKFWRRMIEIG